MEKMREALEDANGELNKVLKEKDYLENQLTEVTGKCEVA